MGFCVPCWAILITHVYVDSGAFESWNHALMPRGGDALRFPRRCNTTLRLCRTDVCVRTTEISVRTPHADIIRLIVCMSTSCEFFRCLCLPLHHGTGKHHAP